MGARIQAKAHNKIESSIHAVESDQLSESDEVAHMRLSCACGRLFDQLGGTRDYFIDDTEPGRATTPANRVSNIVGDEQSAGPIDRQTDGLPCA